MKPLKYISVVVGGALLGGCCSSHGPKGAQGPELVSRGYATDRGSYAEVGVKFTNAGDFFALVNPGRWKSPVATGGSLSWMNPSAWSEDAGRTGRILLGEAALVGGAVAGYALAGSDGDSGSGGSEPASPPPPPPPPTPPAT